MTVTPVVISALPLAVNLNLYQGDDFFLNLTVMNGGVPADLSHSVATATILATSTSVDFTCTIVSNVIQLHLPSAISETLLAGSGRWDCEITTNGIVQTLAAGTVKVTARVTAP